MTSFTTSKRYPYRSFSSGVFFLKSLLLFILMFPVFFACTAEADFSIGDQVRMNANLFTKYTSNNNYAFLNNNSDNLYIRGRAGMDILVNRYLGFTLSGETYSSHDDEHYHLHEEDEDTGLRLAYLDIISPYSNSISLRLGRQEIVKGGERVFGALDWSPLGRTHDAVSVLFKPNSFMDIDIFLIKVDDNSMADAANVDGEAYTASVYTRLFTGPFDSFEAYYVYQDYDEDSQSALAPQVFSSHSRGGDYEVHTVGLLAKIPLDNNIIVGFEGNYQFGDLGKKHLSSYFVHFGIKKELFFRSLSSLSLEYDLYSGDSDNDDNDVNTYQPIFPSYYKQLGLIAWSGPKNIVIFKAVAGGEIIDNLTWRLAAYVHRLHKKDDSAYLWNMRAWHGGAHAGDDPLNSEYLAKGFDIELNYDFSRFASLKTSYSLLEPLDYIDDFLNMEGKSSRTISQFTCSLEVTF